MPLWFMYVEIAHQILFIYMGILLQFFIIMVKDVLSFIQMNVLVL